MSFDNKHYTEYNNKDDDAYNQYTKCDPVCSSIYDVNMDNDAGLRNQNRAILVIDSRNRSIKEEPGKYNMKLKKEYKDVVSIELKRAMIPNSNYVINEGNNMFYFQDDRSQLGRCQYHKIELPIGNYPVDDPTCDSVRSLLEAGLNLVNGNRYTVEVDPNTQLFTFTQLTSNDSETSTVTDTDSSFSSSADSSEEQIFNILFRTPQMQGDLNSGNDILPNSMYEIIGFKPVNRMGKTFYVGDYTYNLRPTKYIVMHIAGLERVDSPNDAVQNAFAILSLNSGINNFTVSDEIDNEVYQKDFNPPLGTLDRLNISFTDHNGKPYNFRGKDHVLVFEIASLSRYSNYNVPGRGVRKC